MLFRLIMIFCHDCGGVLDCCLSSPNMGEIFRRFVRTEPVDVGDVGALHGHKYIDRKRYRYPVVIEHSNGQFGYF